MWRRWWRRWTPAVTAAAELPAAPAKEAASILRPETLVCSVWLWKRTLLKAAWAEASGQVASADGAESAAAVAVAASEARGLPGASGGSGGPGGDGGVAGRGGDGGLAGSSATGGTGVGGGIYIDSGTLTVASSAPTTWQLVAVAAAGARERRGDRRHRRPGRSRGCRGTGW